MRPAKVRRPPEAADSVPAPANRAPSHTEREKVPAQNE
jgi:hypothetical protein